MSDPSLRPPDPVRLVEARLRNPFPQGRDVAFARVEGDGLAALDVRDGDHVVLVRGQEAEYGDLAAVLDPDGRCSLWKVYPEGDRLRLSCGRPGRGRLTPPDPRVHGVVVAVLRRLSGRISR